MSEDDGWRKERESERNDLGWKNEIGEDGKRKGDWLNLYGRIEMCLDVLLLIMGKKKLEKFLS